MLENCPQCGSPIKTIGPGVAKATGKPYGAFQACSANCGWKPPRTTAYIAPTPTPTHQPLTPAQQNPPEKPNWDKISFGKCKYGFLIEAYKLGKDLTITEQEAEAWANAAMRILDGSHGTF